MHGSAHVTPLDQIEVGTVDNPPWAKELASYVVAPPLADGILRRHNNLLVGALENHVFKWEATVYVVSIENCSHEALIGVQVAEHV